MNNNIQVQANSKDLVAYGVISHAIGLSISLCALIAFFVLFPKVVGNQKSYADRMKEFNVAVGKCLVAQQQKYGRQDALSCRKHVNSYLNFYEHR